MKTISLGSMMSTEQLNAAISIWQNDQENFHRRVRDEVLNPNMPDINERLGQENDADYLAYAIEYAFIRSSFS